jgi:mono/diheme cytochrome c family protein
MTKCMAGFVTMLLALTPACSRQRASGPAAQSAVKPPSAVPAAIVAVSGDKQVTSIGTPLDQPLMVQVNDAHGTPVAGASVWFRSVNGTSFQPDFGVTGSDGQFTAAVTIGTLAGRYQIAASTTGAGGKTVESRIAELALGFQENQGRQLSDVYCARCHDSESTPERVSNHDNLIAQPHAFDDGAFLNKMSDPDLLAIISHGGPGLGKSAEMPPYDNTLSKANIAALAAYIRAVADPPYQSREAVYAQR